MKTSLNIQHVLKGTIRLAIFLFLPIFSFAQPNNLCGNATLLTSSTTCVNTAGTITGATYTTIAGACGAGTPAGNRNDVWYRFVANSTNPTLTISGALAASARFQIYSGKALSGNLS